MSFPSRLDKSRPFIPIRIAVATISDSRTPETDRSGDLLVERLQASGHSLAGRAIVSDDIENIQAQIRAWIPHTDVILTTGGTGVTGRDVTPEALRPLFDKSIDGFGEMFRFVSLKSIGTSMIQSRALAGVVEGVYIFALPGSPGACRDGWDEILCWQLDNRHRPCNFVELMPRLQEHETASTQAS